MKKILASLLIALPLLGAASIQTSYADIAPGVTINPQVSANVQASLKKLGLETKDYKIVGANNDLTLVNIHDQLVTFIGPKGETFVSAPIAKLFKAQSQVGDIKYTFLVKYLDQFKNQLITVSPRKPVGHIYMIDNINCPHCQAALKDADKFLKLGYSITYVPFTNTADERLKVSYVLNLSADKRFKAFQVAPSKMPKAKQVAPFLAKLEGILNDFGVQEYPVFINDQGLSLPGYADADQTIKFFSKKDEPFLVQ